MKSEDNKAKCRFPTATQYSRSLHEQQQKLLHLPLHRPHRDHTHCRRKQHPRHLNQMNEHKILEK